MPKIVINEYDLTKAGTGEYENFAVVVPGFVGENCDPTVFDENGIYECSSQTDFVNYIGKRAAEVVTSKLLVKAVSPTIDFAIKYCPDNVDAIVLVKDEDDENKIVEYQYNDTKTYEAAFNALIHNKFDEATGKVEEAEDDATVADEDAERSDRNLNYSVYFAAANRTGKTGYLLDAKNQYIEVNTDEKNAVAHTLYPTVDGKVLEMMPLFAADNNAYYVITGGNEGVNGSYIEDRITHYGNQMAYELLGLGYTVLFKKMSEHNEDKLAEVIAKRGEDGQIVKDEDGNIVLDINKYHDIDDTEEGVTAVLNGDCSAAICELADPNFWECLRDKSTYDFRYLVTGLLTNNDGANTCILSIADHSTEVLLDDASIKDGRGDCIALIDLDCKAYEGKTQTAAIPLIAKEASKWASAYAAVFAPYVSYILADDAAYNNNKVFPASFHYLACAANSANNNFSEWYANAGYTRGVSKYTIEYTGCKLGEIAVQSLEPRFILKIKDHGIKVTEKNKDGSVKRDEKDQVVYVSPAQYEDINTTVAVNLIIKIKSSYYLWGNRTGKKLGTRGASDGDLVAQHFLNIRQLCTTIKKQVYTTCR